MHELDKLIELTEDVNESDLSQVQKAVLKNKHLAINEQRRLDEMREDFLLAEKYLGACLLTHNLVWETRSDEPYYFCAHRKRLFIELPNKQGLFIIRPLAEAPLVKRAEIHKVLHDYLDAAVKNV